MRKSALLGCAVAGLLAGTAGAGDSPVAKESGKAGEQWADGPAKSVPFPKDYRNWTHVKTMLIHSDKHPLFDAFGGVHHIYANDKAVKALKGKREFPNGSVLVFDLKEAPESGGAYTEGKRKIVAAIVRDTKKYADTQGWGFQGWAEGDPSKPALKGINDQKVCATCHQQNTKDMVFTTWAD